MQTAKHQIPKFIIFLLGFGLGVVVILFVNSLEIRSCDDELFKGIGAGGLLMFLSLVINWSDYVKQK